MADINPFEPWRPRHSEDVPPPSVPDDILRPWRDAQRNPAADEPWPRPPTQPEPAWSIAEPNKPGGVGAGFIWLTVLLLVVAAVAWAANGGSHIPRVGAAGLVLWAGILLALVIGRAWRWYARLGCALAGALAMVACWFFVPTMQGNSLFDAQRIVARTYLIQPGDTDSFRATTGERLDIGNDFPRFREEIRLAERSWVARTVNQEVSAAEKERDNDPDAAMNRLTKVIDAVKGTDHHGEVYWELNRARQQVLSARLTRAETDLGARIAKKEYKEVVEQARRLSTALRNEARELDRQGDLDDRVKAIRERNFRAHSRTTEIELQNLLREERYAEVATQGRRAVAELQPESLDLGDSSGVIGRLQQIRKSALVARVKQAQEVLESMLSKNDYDGVPAQARKVEAELNDENAALMTEMDRNPASLPAAFFPMREKALTRRVERASKALEETLAKKDYAGVARRGDELMRELEPEGKAVAKAGWGDRISALRRKALGARLDQAREQSRTQLKQKQYRAMAATGDRTFTELGLEAESVGMADELKKFRDVCRFYAKLAEESGEEK